MGDWNNQKLKDALKNNLQSMSGNKDELIRKVADGIVLGRIPRCTACFGGRYKSSNLDLFLIIWLEITLAEDSMTILSL